MSVGDPPAKPEPTFLRRWSQRKLAAARAEEAERPADTANAAPAPAAVAPAATAAPAPEAGPEARPAGPETPALPDLESLTFDSDFRAFLSPRVDEATQRAALRKLFADPRFNVMDGLDVYIDDYSKDDPIPQAMLAQLEHAKATLAGGQPPQDLAPAEDDAPAAADAAVATPLPSEEPVASAAPQEGKDDDDGDPEQNP